MIRPLAIALAILMPSAAMAQAKPRDTVAAIATEIRARYFSAEKGDVIADALESEAAAGKYDALTDPRDLASALGNRLRPEDAHFAVIWSTEAAAPAPPAGRLPPPGPGPGGPPRPVGADPAHLGNYGIESAQILPGNIGVITMRQFAHIDFSNPEDPARRAIDAALAMVANADAVIIDLRNNGGGSPAMVGYLVSAFTKPDADIYNTFHDRQGTRTEKPDQFYAKPRLDTPLYILTSGRTGSAGESMPYTLQAAKRATIVGEASAGAANPGGMVPIPGGYRVFISAGSPINPITRTNWEGVGVQPDIASVASGALVAAQKHALKAIVAADSKRVDAAWALEMLEITHPASILPAHVKDLSPYAGTYGPLEVIAANQDGTLQVKRGRRPPLTLFALNGDVFAVVGDPLLRFAFERDGAGKVIAVEQRDPSGGSQRQRRDP